MSQYIQAGVDYYLHLAKVFSKFGTDRVTSTNFMCHLFSRLGDLARYYCSDLPKLQQQQKTVYSCPAIYYQQVSTLTALMGHRLD